MKQLEVSLNLSVKKINIVKLKTPIIITQKTLSKIEDRTINARQTIEIEDYGKYNNILLIDDAVGSGSTLNEVAKKIRQKNLCRGKIIGLSIVGSFKGFEVISEI
jgi:predicted amidophosphoribosyltransferase